jgi:pyruvate/2-oxoglutarate dehydrogenase complex dihydrolipoamide acyltransferase (E2) component
MLAITVNEGLWASNMAPKGVLVRWRAHDGQAVMVGQALAEVRIEGALHEILSPCAGLLACSVEAGDLIQPGDRLGWVGNEATAG